MELTLDYQFWPEVDTKKGFFKKWMNELFLKGPYCGRKYTCSSKDSSTHVLHDNQAKEKDMWIS